MTTGITTDTLNLRSGPSTDNRILRVVQPNTQVTILENANGWLKVQVPDSTVGYLSAQFVTIQDVPAPAAAAQPAQTTTPAASQPTSNSTSQPASAPTAPAASTPATVTTTPSSTTPATPVILTLSSDSLNVRSTPMLSTSPDNRIETLHPPATMTALEDAATINKKVATKVQDNQWIKVKTENGNTGYVAAWLVKLAGSTGTSQPAATSASGTSASTASSTASSTTSSATSGAAQPITGSSGRALQPDLHAYIDTIPNNYPIPQVYYDFWAQRSKLGLPDPFDISPTKLDAAHVGRMPINGFGPNSFALANWQAYYRNVCGMHNGLDHIVPTGTPLIALSDGIIVGNQTVWPFLGNAAEKTIVLWCFLPEQYKDAQGHRMLSNVMLAYGHCSNNTVVSRRQVVKAGDVLAISGCPVGETGNDHLHLEVHLLSGDNALPHPGSRKLNPDYKMAQPFDNRTPFNPIFFFSERLLKYHLHQGKKMGFGSGPTYPDQARISGLSLNWPALDFFTLGYFQYGSASIWTVNNLPWPNGIYDGSTMISRINNFTAWQPYPADFI